MYGARKIGTYQDIPTKRGLLGALATNPSEVEFYDTSAFSPEMNQTGADLEVGRKYTVVGPNPYNSRKWYANVIKTADGRFLVK